MTWASEPRPRLTIRFTEVGIGVSVDEAIAFARTGFVAVRQRRCRALAAPDPWFTPFG